jgi:GT2 family glycosyltransferase
VDKSKPIGVVTVTYNSGMVIRDFLTSLLKQSQATFLLYVVDNASSDDTLGLLANHPDPRVLIIRNTENVGVAEGNNIGIRAALRDGCACVLLINNDTVFDSDVISRLLDGIEQYHCDMIVPKILYFNPSDTVWCAGGAFSPLRGSAKHFGFGQKDDGRFDRPREVHYSPTCCMLIKREVFEQIGLMDAKYFVYFDDTDFCLRARRAGLRLVYLPTARVYHKVSSLIGHRSDLALRYFTRNHVYYVMKNFRPWMSLYYLPICQVHVVRRCLIAKNKTKAFSLAEKGFWEGFALFYSEPNSTELVSEGASQSLHPAASNGLGVPESVPVRRDDESE